uniref:Rho GTPase activating protein 10 n=1 Tax=Salmo trutta TaxID=8032 RepID=A0A673VYE4_SALTR
MGLHPLEFSECYLDSPIFREKIKAHEAELDKTNRFIKELYKDGKNLINATKQLVLAQRKFAQSLGEFQFEYIGDAKTDDERCIDESLQEFSNFLKNLEDQRELMVSNDVCPAHFSYLSLLPCSFSFCSSILCPFKAERKKYEKETEKYYSSLEKLLNMSAKKKEPQLQEADSQVETIRQHFQEESLDYVCKLQEIQERKKFDCVEPMLAFFQTVFTFYHQGFELANDFNHYKKALQINIQNTRSRFEGTRVEVFELMKRIREVPQEYRQTSPISSEGYLYVQEKRPPPFGSSWVKRYCTFVKEQKILHMVTFDHRSGGKMGETESVTLKSCVRKTTDMLDRRFCLDIEITDRPGTVLTVQSLSEDDHKFWIHAMGGKEPVIKLYFQSLSINSLMLVCAIKGHVNCCLLSGINDQGLYRVVGVSSKVQKLLSLMIDPIKQCCVYFCLPPHHSPALLRSLLLSTSSTHSSLTFALCVLSFLSLSRSLPEPLMTYGLYKDFIAPAKGGSPESRSQAIHCLVHKLPEKNRLVLGLLMKHLATVAAHSKLNLMTVANLGVVFGPTLMRPQEDTVAAIMDLKFQNIVVEILIEQHEKRPLVMLISWSSTAPLFSCCHRVIHRAAFSFAPLNKGQRCSRPAIYSQRLTALLLLSVSPTSPDVGSNSDEASLGSNESVSSQSTASGTPPEKANHAPLLASLTTGDSPGVTGGGGKRAMAVYPCEAEHESELSFQVGAIFSAVAPSREPGWLEGELEGKKGLIPENYVEML